MLISPQARGDKQGRTEVSVKMKDLTNDNEWLWGKNKFVNRKFIMQEMYQNFVDGDTEWDVEKVYFIFSFPVLVFLFFIFFSVKWVLQKIYIRSLV